MDKKANKSRKIAASISQAREARQSKKKQQKQKASLSVEARKSEFFRHNYNHFTIS
jgi:hypothetical protein